MGKKREREEESKEDKEKERRGKEQQSGRYGTFYLHFASLLHFVCFAFRVVVVVAAAVFAC